MIIDNLNETQLTLALEMIQKAQEDFDCNFSIEEFSKLLATVQSSSDLKNKDIEKQIMVMLES